MSDTPVKWRLPALDIARGIAILCMASYHFSWDLEYFHYLEPGTVGSGFFRLYARAIASSFLFMAGFSLYLSHGSGIRWDRFWKRFAMIAGSALAVTVVTWFAMPEGFIFFGILHQIALASLIGLAALHMPALILSAAGAAALFAPDYLRSPFFDQPWLWWVGLSQTIPRSNDYVPLFPWIAPFLFGLAVSKLLLTFRILEKFPLKETISNSVAKGFSWAGRHSLSIYLIHQPLLFGLVLGFAQVFPAPPPNPETGYFKSCEIQCSKQADEAFCAAFCECTLQRLKDEDLLTKLQSGAINVKKDDNIARISGECSMIAQTPGPQQ